MNGERPDTAPLPPDAVSPNNQWSELMGLSQRDADEWIERQMEYEDFLASKRALVQSSGFEVSDKKINQRLFPFQRDIVRWAIRGAKRAVFAATGLGKTLIQSEWAYQVAKHEKGNVLILAPLAVALQTKELAAAFGITINYCRKQAEVEKGINITNYDMLDAFDPASFVGVVCDESSVMKDWTAATTQKLRDGFVNTKYKLCCTATPSPNDHTELGTKDPVTAMQRTKALGLLHKQIKKDSCRSRQGIPDYLITFRKAGANPEPVDGMFDQYVGEDGTGPAALGAPCTVCNGTKQIVSNDPEDFGDVYPCGACTSTTADTRFSIEVWQRYASPVWMDINPSDTLQRKSARQEQDERHIAPLQLQVIERGLDLWSNPGDIVLDPYAGIGSTGVVCARAGRRFLGIELKESYFKQAVANLKIADKSQGGLFASGDVKEEVDAEK